MIFRLSLIKKKTNDSREILRDRRKNCEIVKENAQRNECEKLVEQKQ